MPDGPDETHHENDSSTGAAGSTLASKKDIRDEALDAIISMAEAGHIRFDCSEAQLIDLMRITAKAAKEGKSYFEYVSEKIEANQKH
jgi:hypothetical protein